MGIQPFFLMPMSYANVELKRSRTIRDSSELSKRIADLSTGLKNRYLYRTLFLDLGEHNDVEIERS